MSTVAASIDLLLLNAVLAKVKASGERTFEKTVSVPFWPDPKIRAKISFAVSNVRAAIVNDRLRLSARVNVQVPPPLQLSYTADATADVEIRIAVPEVIIRATSLVVPVYVKPGGRRIDLGKVNVCSLLPNALEASFKVLPETYTRPLPAFMGGAPVTVRVDDPQFAIQSGAVQVSASLNTP